VISIPIYIPNNKEAKFQTLFFSSSPFKSNPTVPVTRSRLAHSRPAHSSRRDLPQTAQSACQDLFSFIYQKKPHAAAATPPSRRLPAHRCTASFPRRRTASYPRHHCSCLAAPCCRCNASVPSAPRASLHGFLPVPPHRFLPAPPPLLSRGAVPRQRCTGESLSFRLHAGPRSPLLPSSRRARSPLLPPACRTEAASPPVRAEPHLSSHPRTGAEELEERRTSQSCRKRTSCRRPRRKNRRLGLPDAGSTRARRVAFRRSAAGCTNGHQMP
jgi:hypothetical protein